MQKFIQKFKRSTTKSENTDFTVKFDDPNDSEASQSYEVKTVEIVRTLEDLGVESNYYEEREVKEVRFSESFSTDSSEKSDLAPDYEFYGHLPHLNGILKSSTKSNISLPAIQYKLVKSDTENYKNLLKTLPSNEYLKSKLIKFCQKISIKIEKITDANESDSSVLSVKITQNSALRISDITYEIGVPTFYKTLDLRKVTGVAVYNHQNDEIVIRESWVGENGEENFCLIKFFILEDGRLLMTYKRASIICERVYERVLF